MASGRKRFMESKTISKDSTVMNVHNTNIRMLRFPALVLLMAFLFYTPATVSAQGEVDYSASLWEMISRDSFPYLRSHEFTEKVADASLALMMLSKEKVPDGYQVQVLQAYYYNLLAGRFAIADSLVLKALQEDNYIYSNLIGHMALREYLPCFGMPDSMCQNNLQQVATMFEDAARVGTVMPPEQWTWMAAMLRNQLPFPKSSLQLKAFDDGLVPTAGESMEGGILRFQIGPGRENLLVSNGERKPVKVLELDSTGQWIDITSSTGLDTIPGGHRLYNVDYNSDGLDDLFILRKSSMRKSPAKYYPLLLRNEGDGTFRLVSDEAGFRIKERPNCACWDDINGDGRPDVFLGNEYTPSMWMVQQEDGSFKNMSYSYGTLTKNKNTVDCVVADLNGDGLKDLYLSFFGDSNAVYIQKILNEEFFFFYEQGDSLGLHEPDVSGITVAIDLGMNGSTEVMAQADNAGRYDVVAAIMNRKDTIDYEPSLVHSIRDNSGSSWIIEPDFSLYRAGILIEQAGQTDLIAGGGKTTESLYPMFHLSVKDKVSTSSYALPDYWPAYVHSATVYADSNDQPVLVFKGGGSYPFMVHRQVSYRLTMPSEGKFERLFHYNRAVLGSTVLFELQDSEGQTQAHQRVVRALDSRGFYALQEWVFVPKGYQLKVTEVIEKEGLLPLEKPAPEEVLEEAVPGKKKKKR
jgi:hypothetical protein